MDRMKALTTLILCNNGDDSIVTNEQIVEFKDLLLTEMKKGTVSVTKDTPNHQVEYRVEYKGKTLFIAGGFGLCVGNFYMVYDAYHWELNINHRRSIFRIASLVYDEQQRIEKDKQGVLRYPRTPEEVIKFEKIIEAEIKKGREIKLYYHYYGKDFSFDCCFPYDDSKWDDERIRRTTTPYEGDVIFEMLDEIDDFRERDELIKQNLIPNTIRRQIYVVLLKLYAKQKNLDKTNQTIANVLKSQTLTRKQQDILELELMKYTILSRNLQKLPKDNKSLDKFIEFISGIAQSNIPGNIKILNKKGKLVLEYCGSQVLSVYKIGNKAGKKFYNVYNNGKNCNEEIPRIIRQRLYEQIAELCKIQNKDNKKQDENPSKAGQVSGENPKVDAQVPEQKRIGVLYEKARQMANGIKERVAEFLLNRIKN